MLTINIRNDGTRTGPTASYTYCAMVNRKVIAIGEVKNHNRADGWRELVRRVAEEKPK